MRRSLSIASAAAIFRRDSPERVPQFVATLFLERSVVPGHQMGEFSHACLPICDTGSESCSCHSPTENVNEKTRYRQLTFVLPSISHREALFLTRCRGLKTKLRLKQVNPQAEFC
jgi:hypothetical protein